MTSRDKGQGETTLAIVLVSFVNNSVSIETCMMLMNHYSGREASTVGDGLHLYDISSQTFTLPNDQGQPLMPLHDMVCTLYRDMYKSSGTCVLEVLNRGRPKINAVLFYTKI